MIRVTGHSLRLIGLLIEMAGVIFVVRERGGKEVPQIHLPSGPVVSSAWVAVVLGFVIWLVATIILAATKPPRPESH